MPPFSFQFNHPSPDMHSLRQQIAEFQWGVLHYIEINPPHVMVHYANFTKEDVRAEIEKGKMMGNWMLYPCKKIDE